MNIAVVLNANVDVYVQKGIEMLIEYGPKFIGAILLLIVGLWVIGAVTKGTGKVLEHRKIDNTLKGFLKAMVSVLLKVMLIISVLSMVGVEMTSFIAFLGAAGIAVGMALSGSLQNFAGGVMILLFKPFKVDDIIEAQGVSGQVAEIQIFHTVLRTPDKRIIYLPNGPLSANIMTVFTENGIRRVDFGVSVTGDMSGEKVRSLLVKVAAEHPKILKTPEADVIVVAPSPGITNLSFRVYTKAEDFVEVSGTVYEMIGRKFGENAITTPIPIVNVAMLK